MVIHSSLDTNNSAIDGSIPRLIFFISIQSIRAYMYIVLPILLRNESIQVNELIVFRKIVHNNSIN